MEDFTYRFLLQSGYPRAAIVSDLHLLPVAGHANGASTDQEQDLDLERPDFAIVDPLTIDRLAVIGVHGAIDGDALRRAATELGQYAQRFGGRSVQGFLVRLDVEASDPDARVQFYRAWPNETLERVSARAFPDLDALRTLLRLHESTQAAALVELSSGTDAQTVFDDAFNFEGMPGEETADAPLRVRSPGTFAWMPGLALVLLAIVDWYVGTTRGQSLLSTVQAVLVVGAAALLLWPALAGAQRS